MHRLLSGALPVRIYFCIFATTHASNTHACYGAYVASNTKVVPQNVRNHTRAHAFMLFVIFRSFRFSFFIILVEAEGLLVTPVCE